MSFEDEKVDMRLAEEAEGRAESHRDHQKLLEIGGNIIFMIIQKFDEQTEFTITEEEIAELISASGYREINEVLNRVLKVIGESRDKALLAGETSAEYAATVRHQLDDDTSA